MTRSSFLAVLAASLFLLAAVVLLGQFARRPREADPPSLTSRIVTTTQAGAAGNMPGLIKVKVTGGEFAWRYRYAGHDGVLDTRDDLLVKDELRLPLDSDVLLLVTSDDYVYTFSIPDLDLRRIAIPELTYELSFRTCTAGSFDVVADPFCGVRLFHDEQMGRVIVQPRADFDAWLATAR